jgi:hypothetical protein
MSFSAYIKFNIIVKRYFPIIKRLKLVYQVLNRLCFWGYIGGGMIKIAIINISNIISILFYLFDPFLP